MAKERCENCRFWYDLREPKGKGPGTGDCRRFPPVPVWIGNDEDDDLLPGICTTWPETGVAGWCGEFVARSE